MILKMRPKNTNSWNYIGDVIEVFSDRLTCTSKEEFGKLCYEADRESVIEFNKSDESKEIMWLRVAVSCYNNSWIKAICDGEVYLMDDKGNTIERLF
jgi:hypothetical protein